MKKILKIVVMVVVALALIFLGVGVVKRITKPDCESDEVRACSTTADCTLINTDSCCGSTAVSKEFSDVCGYQGAYFCAAECMGDTTTACIDGLCEAQHERVEITF